MGKLYHGLANPSGFRSRRSENPGFLLSTGVWPYLRRIGSAGIKSVATLTVLFTALSVTTTTYAGSSGRLDPFLVREKIKRDLPKINRCYESALRYEPELEGKVEIQFAVVRNGSVKGVQVIENTTGHQGVERCVARVVSAIRFPSRRTGKSVRFTFPFVFAPQHAR